MAPGEVSLKQLVEAFCREVGREPSEVFDVLETSNPLFFVVIFNDGDHADMTVVPPTH
jgi:hypothetical protein